MLSRTHLAFAFLLALLYLKFFNSYFNIIVPTLISISLFIILTLFFSILPDIDTHKSLIGRKTPILSHIIQFIFKHRGFIHSIFPIILLAIIFAYLRTYMLELSLLIGYLSHLISDSITKEGIKPFYPFSNLRLHGFLHTGSFLEFIIFLILILVDVWLMIGIFI